MKTNIQGMAGCVLVVLLSGCLSTNELNVGRTPELLDKCSTAYQQAFDIAIAAGDVTFCLGETPDPEFIQDGYGDYCFVPNRANPENFFTLHETSLETDCVDIFAQITATPDHCTVLQSENYPSSGIGETAYNNCVINYAAATGEVKACDLLENSVVNEFGLPDDQECIKAVAWTTKNSQLCDDYLQNTDVYDLCLSNSR